MDCVPGSDRYILLYSLNKRQRWTLLERLRHLAEESAHDIRAHNLHLSVYCHQMYPSFYRSSYDPTRALSLTSTKFAANADLDDGDEQASLCTVYTSRPSGAAVFRNLWENGKRLRGRSDVTQVEDVKDIGYEIGLPWKYDAFYFHKQFHSQQPAYRGRKSSIKTKACRNKVGSQSSSYRFLPPERRTDYADVDCTCCWRMHNWVDENSDEDEYDNSDTVPASRAYHNQFHFDRLEDYISQSGTRKAAQKRGKPKRRVSTVLEGEYDFCDDELDEYDLCDTSG
ncbi:uncharacterized protein LOC129597244 [Paramacrobiotus metropolitanus]|uniref:uncharacterized protein LOC129597244 n=1 Tax=Paramacrobiotus metropolitanus TaxID=2943436 RepID=UPI00244626DF|nr:uncharacterized protein LOC129597244 [Paramacrobiotus metropolitanus]